MVREYGEEDEDEDNDVSHDDDSDEDNDKVPDLINSADFQHLTDDFLNNYEIVGGRKLRQVMPGETGTDKLDALRTALGKDRILEHIQRQAQTPERDNEIPMPVDIDDIQDRWDCETILCESDSPSPSC